MWLICYSSRWTAFTIGKHLIACRISSSSFITVLLTLYSSIPKIKAENILENSNNSGRVISGILILNKSSFKQNYVDFNQCTIFDLKFKPGYYPLVLCIWDIFRTTNKQFCNIEYRVHLKSLSWSHSTPTISSFFLLKLGMCEVFKI